MNKGLRVFGVCAGALALGSMLSGCGVGISAQSTPDVTVKVAGKPVNLSQAMRDNVQRAQKVVAELNQVTIAPETAATRVEQVNMLAGQINQQFPGLINEGIVRQLKTKELNYRDVLMLLPVADYLADATKHTKGWTDADLRKVLVAQFKGREDWIAKLSGDAVNVVRVFMSQNLNQVSPLDKKISAQYQALIKGIQGLPSANLEDGPHDQLLEQATQGMLPIYRPNVAAGVSLQGMNEASEQIQQMIMQMQQMQAQPQVQGQAPGEGHQGQMETQTAPSNK